MAGDCASERIAFGCKCYYIKNKGNKKMAKQGKIKVSEEEYARRKSLDLPVTKPLRYMRKTVTGWEEIAVVDYEIDKVLKPSGMSVLALSLETGEVRRILSAYFSEMQKPSFERDMNDAAVREE